MTDQESERNPFDFTPFLRLFFSKRKIIVFNALFITVVSLIYAFFVAKKEYYSSISFLPPASTELNILDASGILSSLSPSTTKYSVSNDQIGTIFDSRALKRRIIDKFDLYRKYHLLYDKDRFEKAVKKLDRNLGIESMEIGYMNFSNVLQFTISSYSTSPDTAYLMAKYAFNLLDSSIQKISSERATRNRIFIQGQLSENMNRLDSLQGAMESFQKENKAIDFPEQAKSSLRVYAEIKATLTLNELKLKRLKEVFANETPEMKDLESENEVYREKLSRMEKDTTSAVLPNFPSFRNLFAGYLNLKRETATQEAIVTSLEKEVEQARLQEQKDVSSLITFDPAFPADAKARPKRAKLVLMIVFSYLYALLFILVLVEIVKKRQIITRIST